MQKNQKATRGLHVLSEDRKYGWKPQNLKFNNSVRYNGLDLLCWRKMTHFQASKIHATTNGMQILHETRDRVLGPNI